MLVRRAPGHSCVAHVRDTKEGVTLLRVTPDKGAAPFWADLEGETFPERRALRNALLSRMRADAGDVTSKISVDDVPDETVEPQPDGALRISVALPAGESIEMTVPADQWKWRDH